MVAEAKRLRQQVVILYLAGSTPVGHPQNHSMFSGETPGDGVQGEWVVG